MAKRQLAPIVSVLGLIMFVLAVLGQKVHAGDGHGHGHDEHADEHEDHEQGPHGGRMLLDEDGFGLEVTIFEPGIPPQSRIYPYKDSKPLNPDEVELSMELHRFDRVDHFKYSRRDDFLFGDKVVEEPHSFDVKIHATYQGKTYHWEYESHEGRTEISQESAKISGIETAVAETRTIVERIPALGRVGFNQEAVSHVAARYGGVVRSLNKRLGDYARKGDNLGVIHGTDSLNEFALQAPRSGRIVEKHVATGEVVEAGQVMFAIADLSTLWVDFTIYQQDAGRINSGQKVQIVPEDGLDALSSKLAYVDPVGDAASQSIVARAFVRNHDGRLRPGLFVKGFIEIGATESVAVKRGAIQTFRDWQVVFLNRGTLYEIAVVEPGIDDGEYVQIISGLSPGATYVSQNSFIVKADIGKAGASHDH